MPNPNDRDPELIARQLTNDLIMGATGRGLTVPAPRPLGVVNTENIDHMFVLTDFGDARFNAILSGTVGRLDESGRIEIDPDYRRLNYLFTLQAKSALPVIRDDQPVAPNMDADGMEVRVGEKVVALSVPTRIAPAVRATLISLCAERWEKLYDMVGGHIPAGAMAADMIAAERASVNNAVKDYLQERDFRSWDVPVVYQSQIQPPNGGPCSERGLMSLADAAPASRITSDTTRSPISSAVAEDARAMLNQNAGAITEADRVLDGTQGDYVNLMLEGSIKVLARSAQDAAIVGAAILKVVAAAPIVGATLRPKAWSVQSFSAVSYGMDDGQDDDDDDEDDGDDQGGAPAAPRPHM